MTIRTELLWEQKPDRTRTQLHRSSPGGEWEEKSEPVSEQNPSTRGPRAGFPPLTIPLLSGCSCETYPQNAHLVPPLPPAHTKAASVMQLLAPAERIYMFHLDDKQSHCVTVTLWCNVWYLFQYKKNFLMEESHLIIFPPPPINFLTIHV